jgi:hypothetical protein
MASSRRRWRAPDEIMALIDGKKAPAERIARRDK